MRTILVIDDHVVTLWTLCLILKGEGYEALPAKNADQALNISSGTRSIW